MSLGIIIYFIIMFFIGALFLIKKEKLKVYPILYWPLSGKWEKYGIKIEKPIADSEAVETKSVIPILFVATYRTKLGIKFIDKCIGNSKAIKVLLKTIGYISIILCIGVAIFALISFSQLIWLKHFTTQAVTQPGVVFVLPFKIRGQVYVPFFYWIISIFILAAVHEVGHAIIARLNDIPIDYTGPAFFCFLIPIIPAAFVEPDKKIMESSKKRSQLSMIATGPGFNVLFGIIFLLIWVGLTIPAGTLQIQKGVHIDSIENTALIDAGLKDGDIISYIDRFETGQRYHISNTEHLANFLMAASPGEEVAVCTTEKCTNVIMEPHPNSAESSSLGIHAFNEIGLKEGIIEKYGEFFPRTLLWLVGLFMWLTFLNIGIGVANALPIGMLDGGQIVNILTKDNKYNVAIVTIISIFYIGLIILTVI